MAFGCLWVGMFYGLATVNWRSICACCQLVVWSYTVKPCGRPQTCLLPHRYIIWLTKARHRLLNSPNWRDFAIAWRRCSDWARLLLAARIRIQLILADLAPKAAVSIDPLEAAKIRAKYTHFRILVIGRANAGKTTLLKRVCNTKKDPVYSEVRYMHFALYPTPLSSFPHQQINPTSKVPTQWSFCISLIWSLTLMP